MRARLIPRPAPSRQNRHIGDLPAPAAARSALHRYIAYNPFVLHPDESVEYISELAGTAVENAHQPAHITEKS